MVFWKENRRKEAAVQPLTGCVPVWLYDALKSALASIHSVLALPLYFLIGLFYFKTGVSAFRSSKLFVFAAIQTSFSYINVYLKNSFSFVEVQLLSNPPDPVKVTTLGNVQTESFFSFAENITNLWSI